MEFLFQNPLILLGIVLTLLILSVYFISKTGNKKSSNKKKDKNVNESETVSEKDESLNVDNKEKKKKLKKLKPEITRVYEKKQLQSKTEKNESVVDKSAEEEELLKRMQFVKSSGRISKLKPYVSEKEEEVLDDYVQESEENRFLNNDYAQESEDLKKSNHFDRTRRLSKMIKEDAFDDMFCSHISEKYMNMNDIEKHIRNCSEIQEKLYLRAAETMANSAIKVSISDDGKVDENMPASELKSIVEEKKREALAGLMVSTDEYKESIETDYDYEDIVSGEIDLSARNILVVDALLKRKGKKG